MGYNVDHFDPGQYVFGSFGGARLGDVLVVDAVDVDGAPVSTRDLRGAPVVLETGSATCPMYHRKVEAMQDLARRHPDIHFRLLYTREAHPGRRLGPHEAMEEKRRRAAALSGRFGVAAEEHRTVWVDDLEGTAHARLGTLPNSVHVLDAAGTVVYRSQWNDPVAVAQVLERMQVGRPLDVPARYLVPPPSVALRTFRLAGRGALRDFVRALPRLLRMRRRLRGRLGEGRT